MTQDEIIEMARQAGIVFDDKAMPYYERFAKLVADKERVACFDAAFQAYATTEVLEAIKARVKP